MGGATEIEYFGSPPPRPMSARQVAARNAVLVAAADAFNARGYAATSIDDIADRLGATKGRIYHYFRTKGEIFLGVHRRALELAYAAVRPGAESEGQPAERLHAMAEAHALLVMTEPSFMRLVVRPGEITLAAEGRTRQEDIDSLLELYRGYDALFEEIIAEGVASGAFCDEEPAILARAVLGSLNGMTFWYEPTEDDEAARAGTARMMASFVTDGLRGVGVGTAAPSA